MMRNSLLENLFRTETVFHGIHEVGRCPGAQNALDSGPSAPSHSSHSVRRARSRIGERHEVLPDFENICDLNYRGMFLRYRIPF